MRILSPIEVQTVANNLNRIDALRNTPNSANYLNPEDLTEVKSPIEVQSIASNLNRIDAQRNGYQGDLIFELKIWSVIIIIGVIILIITGGSI